MLVPKYPPTTPPMTANTMANNTFKGGLNPKGAKSPGIGAAVPGALFTIPKTAAPIPANPPPIKFEKNIGTGFL